MADGSLTPIYLNENMLQDLSASFLDGFFSEKRTRVDTDKYALGRSQNIHRRQNTDDIRSTPVPIEGRRPESINSPFSRRGPQIIPELINEIRNVNFHLSLDEAILNYDEFLRLLEARNDIFTENEVVKLYTILAFHDSVISELRKQSLLKTISFKDDNDINKLCIGDYIEYWGLLNTNSAVTYTSTIASLLQDYGTTTLDTAIDTSTIGPLTYTAIYNLLNTLNTTLNSGGNSELTATSYNTKSLLILVNAFLTSKGYVYDCNNCLVRIIGKVARIAKRQPDCISLFSKTGFPGYYNQLISSITPYLNTLTTNGYIVPIDYISSLSAPAFEIIPLSISI